MIIEKLWNERVSYSEYDKTPISEYNLKKILEAADGVTPSLGNNYHYRVDVLPEILKKDMWPYMQTTNDWCLPETKAEFDANYASKTDNEWRDLGICFNWQFKAPLVLAYSMPRSARLDQSWGMPPGFPTGREATLIALGLSTWNVVLTVEELGLNSDLKFLYRFQYQASFGEAGSENELCSVYVGRSDDRVIVNVNEISQWRFVSIADLNQELSAHPDQFTPWFKMEWTRLQEEYLDDIESL